MKNARNTKVMQNNGKLAINRISAHSLRWISNYSNNKVK
uniref:Uncharacterized protein n=1 Tax=Arundo donax TaxID=35708 RepID=A0A0A9HEX4_ARUDO